MRKTLGLLVLVLGIAGVGFSVNQGTGAPKQNMYCYDGIGTACPACEQKDKECTIYIGPYTYYCNPQQNSTCDQEQVEPICAGYIYSGNCYGIGCYPVQCCLQGMDTGKRKSFKTKSCVP